MARTVLFGTPVSPGIAIGVIRLMHDVRLTEERRISPRQVAAEVQALCAAASDVRADLQDAMRNVPEDLAEYREVIAAQMELVRDPKLLDSACARIRKELICAPWALDRTVEELCDVFRGMDDPYLRDRAQDIRAVGLRLRERLAGALPRRNSTGPSVLGRRGSFPG